jgi:hypothetical protein
MSKLKQHIKLHNELTKKYVPRNSLSKEEIARRMIKVYKKLLSGLYDVDERHGSNFLLIDIAKSLGVYRMVKKGLK